MQALFYIGPEVSRLRPMFREHVAPCFFRLYPKGKIVVLRYDTAVDGAAALLRLLYAASQAPPQELLAGKFQGIQTLQSPGHGQCLRLSEPACQVDCRGRMDCQEPSCDQAFVSGLPRVASCALREQ